MKKENHTVIIYYKYIHIEDPVKLMQDQKDLCVRLGVKGRILIAHEGINGTAEGTDKAIEEYIKNLKNDPRFADVHVKTSKGTGQSFPRLQVKVRKEIVTLGLPKEQDIDPTNMTGKYLEPEMLYEWIRTGKDFTIVDMRNDYEHKLGYFDKSILPPMSNFRDLPKVLPQLESVKNSTVVTVCTSGVRCEKASGYLVKQGFADVYQLHGGISTYMEKYKNDDFKGKLYVFDNRMSLTFTPDEERSVIGRCEHCRIPSEEYINCKNNECHRHFICCNKCQDKKDRQCREVCNA